MNILPCNDATGSWCCADGAVTPCCQVENPSTFYLDPGTVTFIRAGLSTVDSPSSTSAIASTTTTTTTSGAATTTSSGPSATAEPQATETTLTVGGAVGLGIGVGIPTILAIVFGILWWIERVKRKAYETNAANMEEPILPPAPYGGGYGGESYGLQPPAQLHNRSISSELSSAYGAQAVESANIMELSAHPTKPPDYIGR
ncbi:hypothetical protein ABW20_dc0102189 [Dactylellina cionopaga]|nr:hypothetical protein ABW20_dc0102189 [Dactylellina cionopaga]